jgi:hypothetical protein
MGVIALGGVGMGAGKWVLIGRSCALLKGLLDRLPKSSRVDLHGRV